MIWGNIGYVLCVCGIAHADGGTRATPGPAHSRPDPRRHDPVCVVKAPRARSPGPQCVGDPARVHSSGALHPCVLLVYCNMYVRMSVV